MRIDALRSFVRLIELGSYAAAADSLYMSTSTLHSQIRSLEADLQSELVVFSGRALCVTDVGAQLLPFARRTLDEYDDLHRGVANRQSMAAGTLRVVGIPSFATYILPVAARQFSREYPNVRVVIDGRRIGDIVAAVIGRQTDVAFVTDYQSTFAKDVYTIEPIMVSKHRLIVRRDRQIPHDVNEILRVREISAQPHSPARVYFEQWARARGVNFHVKYEHSMMDGIMNDVWFAGCIGLVNEYVYQFSYLKSNLNSLDLPEFDFTTRQVAIDSSGGSRAVAEFLRFVREICAVQPTADVLPSDTAFKGRLKSSSR